MFLKHQTARNRTDAISYFAYTPTRKTSLNSISKRLTTNCSRLQALIDQVRTSYLEKLSSIRNICDKCDNYLYSCFPLLNTDDFHTNECPPNLSG